MHFSTTPSSIPLMFRCLLSAASDFTIESKRKAINRNWSNQKANPALNTKAGNK